MPYLKWVEKSKYKPFSYLEGGIMVKRELFYCPFCGRVWYLKDEYIPYKCPEKCTTLDKEDEVRLVTLKKVA